MFTPPLLPSPERVAAAVDEWADKMLADHPEYLLKSRAELRHDVALGVIRGMRKVEWSDRPFEEPDAA